MKIGRLVLFIAFLSLLLAPAGARAGEKRFTVLGLGDSITEGGEAFGSYLYPLWQRLFTAGYNADFIGPRQSNTRIGPISHYGNSGKPVEFLDEHIDSVYRRYPADIVLLHAGHNHFAHQQPIEGMLRAYTSIIGKIRAVNPRAHIFIAQVTPSGKLPKYSYIPELNRRIAALVDSLHDRRLHLVDMATGHDWPTMTIEDRVHPNERGAAWMADRWLQAISRVFKPHRKAFAPELVPYSTPGDGRQLCLHVFRAKGRTPRPAIVYFFAGGWQHGTPLQFYRECEWHSRHGYTAISVDYRIRAIDGTTPADATADGLLALAYIRSHARQLGIDTARIVVAGASAGAVIAGQMPDSCVQARMLYYPVVDSLMAKAPAMHKPVLFMMGTADSFTPIGKARAFADTLQQGASFVHTYYYNGLGHPLFRYREPLPPTFYTIRRRTDHFLRQLAR